MIGWKNELPGKNCKQVTDLYISIGSFHWQ